jgi:hypothetical protein
MSLLTACQNVVNETGLGDAPATIISNTDKLAVQLLALAKREAKILAAKNWQAMIREQTLTVVSGTSGYSLPADWARYVCETFWDTTNYWEMRGSIDPKTWQALKRGIVAGTTLRKDFRVVGNLVQVYPTPTNSTDVLIGEYLRNTPWVDTAGTTFRTSPTADTDTTVFPEKLLELGLTWRLKEAKGLDFTTAFNEYEREVATAFAQDTPAPALDFSTTGAVFNTNIPQNIPT